MITDTDLIDALGDSCPPHWRDAIWINHSDLPSAEKPNTFRCKREEEPLPCAHAFHFADDGTWNPQVFSRNPSPVPPTVKVDTVRHLLKVPGVAHTPMRNVYVGQCPICQRVHYAVERFEDEWFDVV